MLTIKSNLPSIHPPAWAYLERALIDLVDRSVYPYLEKYTRPDGSLRWMQKSPGDWQTRDGVDDFYESFVNWPLYYLLGGGDHILSLADRQWDALTRQLSEIGAVHNEYEPGYDQFHQSEHYTYFYHLCMADPHNPKLRQRACRFAGFYTGEDPSAPNYDPAHKIIRSVHNGSTGPRWGYFYGEPVYGWSSVMQPYGLPFEDIPGITSYEDLQDPELARRMGQAMHERMGRGDAATNLMVTSLVTNAFLLTGEEKYRDWILEYTDAWIERARQNGGLLPDNVGLNGIVGEYLDGRWYGGGYGWSWPHGYYNIGMAATVAGANAFLLTGEPGYLNLPRVQMDAILSRGVNQPISQLGEALRHHWSGQLAGLNENTTILMFPYRYRDSGWFDYQLMSPIYPTAVWNLSQDPQDWERLERIRLGEPYDWRTVFSFRTKEESGHEQPWLRYLAGENPGYPEAILRACFSQVSRRLEWIASDDLDLEDPQNLHQTDVHHWQRRNPVLTEALVQLTLGAPQPIYNGGLLFSSIRYYDAERQRPGLPQDVAALVNGVCDLEVDLNLVNLNAFEPRRVIIQAGSFAQNRFTHLRYSRRISEYPGPPGSYIAPPMRVEWVEQDYDDPWVEVELPPASELQLDLSFQRFTQPPSYQTPFPLA
jgi:hypothetical protein